MAINKKEAQRILEGLSGIIKNPPIKKGTTDSLDIAALNKLPEVIFAVKRLKKLGISRKWLWDNGFMAAGLVLTFGDK